MLPANTNQALAILRVDQKKAEPNYVSLFLSQPSIIEYVNNMSGQSAQPNINFEEIKSIEVLLPPIKEQQSIASVLSSLDDKIDLLHRQNKTLEAMVEEQVQTSPSPESYYLLGELNRELKNIPEAIKGYKKALGLEVD